MGELGFSLRDRGGLISRNRFKTSVYRHARAAVYQSLYSNIGEQMELLNIPEVCKLLRISRAKLYNLWHEGNGPRSVYLGSKRLVVRSDLENWIENLRA